MDWAKITRFTMFGKAETKETKMNELYLTPEQIKHILEAKDDETWLCELLKPYNPFGVIEVTTPCTKCGQPIIYEYWGEFINLPMEDGGYCDDCNKENKEIL